MNPWSLEKDPKRTDRPCYDFRLLHPLIHQKEVCGLEWRTQRFTFIEQTFTEHFWCVGHSVGYIHIAVPCQGERGSGLAQTQATVRDRAASEGGRSPASCP